MGPWSGLLVALLVLGCGQGAGAAATTAPADPVAPPAPTGYDPAVGWTLVWSDEFEGTAVDPASWTFDLGAGGWGNSESEFYRAENASVSGGSLTITAKAEAFGGAPYTSARLQTSQKRAFTYGKFSMRARLPYGQGMWPAFWLLGANSSSFNLYGGTVPWPGCGEADIMEMIGGLADGSGDFTTHGALHYLDAGGRNPAPTFASRFSRRLSEDFHVYELVWTPHSFTWLLDGVAYGTKVVTADMEEFSRPMFILLNLAVGGPWGGWADASTIFPQTYVIDYVRVYTNASTVPGGAPGLASSWHLLGATASGVTPAGEALDAVPGTTFGFQPTKALTAPASWYSVPLTGSFEAGAWSVGLFTTSPGASSVLRVEVFKTAADGSTAASLGSAQVDTSTTGGGNHRSWLTLTGVPAQPLANQRIKLVVTPVSGAASTLIYNGNDYDSLLTTPWSAAGP
jgi:beta-glucanase (GH16 family)